MVANILPSDPPPPPKLRGQKVKIKLFQNNVVLHINLKGIMNAATWSQIFCLQTPPPTQPPCSWGWGQNSTFSEHGEFDHVAFQIKGITNAAVLKQILGPQPPPPPPHLGMGSIGQKSKHGHVAYQIKGNH